MILCQICSTFKEPRKFAAYKRECSDCRRARRRLAREGVSLKAMKAYLQEVGLKVDFPIVDEKPEPAVSIDAARRKKDESKKPHLKAVESPKPKK